MKSPIWIFNSLFLLTLFGLVAYIGLYREKLPKRQSIEPSVLEVDLAEKEVPKANIKRIYERDLFGTYQPEEEIKPEQPKKREIKQVPTPPSEKAFQKTPPKEVEFIKPLGITLKGIIFTTPEKAQAIIEINETKKENLFKSGDKIFDAHILRIFKDKIILLRANGQQEIIYADKEQAKKAIEKMQKSSWSDIIEQKSNYCFIVDPERFAKKLNNLAEVIDILDLTTVFKNGESIGLRVGQLKENSLGKALGLESNDIIASIDKINPTTTQNRLVIYNKIVKSKINDIIKVKICRNQDIISINYILKNINSNTKETKNILIENKPENNVNDINKKLEILESKSKLKPIDRVIKRTDRKNMLNQGSKDAILKNLVI